MVAVVVLILAVVVAWDRLGQPRSLEDLSRPAQVFVGNDYERYHNKTFTCINVVDGDTIDIDIPDGKDGETRIRLWGVDTPETGKGGRRKMHYGDEATAMTVSLVLGRPVRVVLDEKSTRDKYQRLLAYVYLDDIDAMLNEELIAAGCAYADRRFPHAWKKRFVLLETKAIKQNMGLWQNVTRNELPEWRQRYDDWRAGD